MRPRRALLTLPVLLAALLALPATALGSTAAELRTLAESYSMTCAVNASDITCLSPASRVANWRAVIEPAAGELTRLRTEVEYFPQPPLDAASAAWMADMQDSACGSPAEVKAYVDTVAAMTNTGTIDPAVVGVCTMGGGMSLNQFERPVYFVVSVVLPPPSTPPSAGPSLTPAPTSAPTAPPATGTPSSQPTVPSGSIEPAASPGSSVEPSPSFIVLPATPPSSLSPSPSSAVSPIGGPASPAPSSPVGGAGGLGGPGGGGDSFAASIVDLGDVALDAGAVTGSALIALLLLLIIGFAAELFNNTVENNYVIVSSWFKHGPLAALSSAGAWLGRRSRVGLAGFLVLTALVSSFVDPTFGLDVRSLAVFLGFLVGLVVVLASFKLPPMLAHRRQTGELGRLRPLPWALVIAAVFVLVSRLGNLQPGYLYGIVLGAIFVKDVSDEEEGRETFYGSLWTLAAALLAWLGLEVVRGGGGDPSSFGVTLLSTAFAAILVAGLEATAFGLMPLRFMPGHAVYRWNRLAWAVLFGLSVFAFIHVLIGPTSGYVSSLSPAAFLAALGVFAAFGALSIGTWAYFRFRRPPAVEPAEA